MVAWRAMDRAQEPSAGGLGAWAGLLAALVGGALALAVFFTMRFLNTGKWMPGGISMILSGLTFILMLVALLRKE